MEKWSGVEWGGVGWGGVGWGGCSSSQHSNDNMPSVSLLPRLPPAPDSPDMEI